MVKPKTKSKKVLKKTAKKTASKRRATSNESDSMYVLKLALCLIIGSLWLRLSFGQSFSLPIPLGLLVGAAFVAKDSSKVDRKIEYALLLAAMFIGFWLPTGLYIGL